MSVAGAQESDAPGSSAASRSARWQRWLVALLVLGLFAVALRLLEGEIRHLRYHDIRAALSEVSRGSILLALLATAASYAILPGYDLVALTYAGHRLPLRQIAYGSVVTYGISQTLGLPAFTGSALRLRLWSSWGLNTTELGRAVTFASFTFTLGIVTLGGIVGVLEPAASLARLHLPVAPVRTLSVLCLLIAVTYVTSSVVAPGRDVHFRRLTLRVPPPGLVAAQLLVASVDWILAAVVLFVLLPGGHDLRFPGFVAVFLLAQTAGILSHVPGGLGVFESLILLQVGDGVATERLVASLLAYRAIFYFVPFATASAMLALHELRQQSGPLRRVAGVVAAGFERWAEPLLPRALGLMTMVGGGILLLSGATPAVRGRLVRVVELLPLGVVELSHFAGSVLGAGLLVLGWALTRRLDAAYHLSRGMLALAIVASLLKGLDWEEALVLALVLSLLTAGRDAFYRRSSLLAEPLTPAWIASIAAMLGVSIWVGLFSFKHVEYTSDLWWRFATHGDAPRFLRATAGAAGLLVLFAALRLLRHAPVRPSLPDAATLGVVRGLLPAIEDTSASLALLGDKAIMLSERRDGFLMYGVSGRSWIAMGDPVGPVSVQRELAWRFVEEADLHGGWPVFYEVSAQHLPLYIDLGLTLLKMGEEAVVPLADFSLDGGSRKGLRRTRRDVQKAGAEFSIVEPAAVQPLLPALRDVSEDWLLARATREKGFSLGRFDDRYLTEFPVATVHVQGRVVAFANVWTGNGRELSIDLMRYRHDAPSGVMEYLFTELMLWGRAHGFQRITLGMAPLSGLEVSALAPLWNRVGGLLYRHGENFYNFQGLRRYKEKFDPLWEPRYLATPAGLALPRILTNVGSLISGGITGLFIR